MNPEDLARQRWRPVAKAVEKRNRLVEELNVTNERLAALHAELPQAEQADREAFATALTAGKDEPERRVTQINAGIETLQRRAQAYAVAVEKAEQELRSLCSRNASRIGETQRSIVKARSAYQAAIAAVAAAREQLADEVGLYDWLRTGNAGSSVTDALQGTPGSGRLPLSFSGVMFALNDDADEIAIYLSEPEPRPQWEALKGRVEALVGTGISREEALRQAGPSDWGGD